MIGENGKQDEIDLEEDDDELLDDDDLDDDDLDDDDETSEDEMPDIGGDTLVDVSGELRVEELVAKLDSDDPDEVAHRREVRRRLEEIAERRNQDLDDTFNFDLDDNF